MQKESVYIIGHMLNFEHGEHKHYGDQDSA